MEICNCIDKIINNNNFYTIKQIADFYNTSKKSIESIVMRYKDELTSNGLIVLKGKELKEFKINNHDKTLNKIGSLTLLKSRSLLQIALILEESDIAKNIREILIKDYPNLYIELTIKPTRFKRYEDRLEFLLQEIFGNYITLEKQVKCGRYKIDFVINNLIAIECDEYGHSSYDINKEKVREEYILNRGYQIVRYNPHKDKIFQNIIPSIMNILNNISIAN